MEDKHYFFAPFYLRLLVWVNITFQIIFPLAVVFTPAIAESNTHFLTKKDRDTLQHTREYTLSAGETAASVADRYNITTNALRELNQYRTFARGFDNVLPGDKINVPLDPLPEVRWETTPAVPNDAEASENEQTRKVASFASRTGSFLANTQNSEAVASMARGMATSAASGEIQQWLGRFGTAQVHLDVDENFSLKNSQLDLLIPLYEQKDKFVFTQGSIHRTDDRTQANIGTGVRHFYDQWMFGVNTFIDYDLSRNHARAGGGLEYWRDFLKLSANGYRRLTGWKDSPDQADYQERPANGWDIRAQSWLPALPWLGGKLAYEQYYGNEVALFGKDNRQRNPHAITAGINYTPVPLLTFSAEQRQGKSGENDTRFGFELNYQLGIPWQQQINPNAVTAMRSLAGSRYDLVDRNNNIVLEYRKKEVIHLKTVDLVTGYAGERKSLGVSVNSKYRLERIDWSASSLLAAGGKVLRDGTDWVVILPEWKSGSQEANSYTLSGVAVDIKGNHSNQSDTHITVQKPDISRDNSSFTPAKSALSADGVSKQVLMLTVENDRKIPVDVPESEIVLRTNMLKTASVSTFERKSTGVYEVTVTAGTETETVTLTPSVMGMAISPAVVIITAGVPDGTQSAFSADPHTIAADNTTLSTLTFTAKDAQGNAVTGIAAKLTFVVQASDGGTPAGSDVTLSAVTESSTAGTYTATLKGTRADTYTVQPLFSGAQVGQLSDTVTLTAGVPDGTQSAFSADPHTIAADNTTLSTLTFTAKDAQGNAVTGIAGQLTFAVQASDGGTPAGSDVTLSAVTESSTAGTYTATLKGTRADTYTVQPLFSGAQVGQLSDTVTLTAGVPDGTQSAFSADPHTIAADNTTTSTLTFTAKDAQGNAVTGIAGQLTFAVQASDGGTPAGGDVTLSAVTESSTAGTYTATLKGTRADTYTVQPLFSGAQVGQLSDTVTLTAGVPDGTQSAFSADPHTIAADNTTLSTLTFTAKDAQGNAVTGIAGQLTFAVQASDGGTPAGSDVTLSAVTESSTAGTYTATLKGTRADTYTVQPLFSGAQVGQLSDTVTLTAGVPDGTQSAFSADPHTIAADNTTTSTLTFTAKDAQGNAVTGIAGQLTFAVQASGGGTPAGSDVTLSAVTESSTAGTYTATLKGTRADTYTVQPLFSGAQVGQLSDTVTLTAGVPDGTQSAFSADPHTIAADNTTTSTLTFTAKDAQGNAVTGIAGQLTFAVQASGGGTPAGSDVTLSAVTESSTAGTYTATLKGTRADTYTVQPLFSGAQVGQLSDTVTLTAGVPDGTQSAFSADPHTIAADNTTTSTLTFTAKDAQGNAVTGIAGQLTFAVQASDGGTPAGSDVTLSAVTESSTAGTYTATLKGTRADTYTVQPLFSGAQVGQLSDTVTLTAGVPDGTQSAFSADPHTIAADNTTTSTLTFTAKDAQGNAVTGIAGQLTFAVQASDGGTPAGSDVTLSAVTESSTAGTYTATLKGTRADTYTVQPLFSGAQVGQLSDTVTLTAGVPDGTQSAFSADPHTIAADNTTLSTLTFTAKDAQGNAVTGIAGQLTFAVQASDGGTPAGSDVTLSAVTESSTAGTYTATLKGTRADTYTVQPLFSGAQVGQLSDTVTLTAGVPDGTQSAFSADPHTIAADNTTTSTLTFTAKDAQGNAVTGIAGQLTFAVQASDGGTPAGGDVTLSAVTESSTAGTYTATLKGTRADTYTVQPLFSGAQVGQLSDTVTLTAGVPDGTQSAFSADPHTIAADNTTLSTLTFTAKDAQGNAVTGIAGQLTFAVQASDGGTPAGSDVTLSAVTESSTAGTYTATLKGTRADTYTVQPLFSGAQVGQLSDTVELTPLSLFVSVDKNKVKVGESVSLHIRYQDPDTGTGLTNVPVNFSIESVVDRQGNTRSDSGPLLFNGQTATAFSSRTGAGGELDVQVTDPTGIGVKTTFKVKVDGHEKEINLIFTVFTSPDTDKANMWGHMTETVNINGIILSRPPLAAETSTGIERYTESNEVWELYRYDDAVAYCSLPPIDTLVDLYSTLGNVNIALGWPMRKSYRSSTSVEDGFHSNINMVSGIINTHGGDQISHLYIACISN